MSLRENALEIVILALMLSLGVNLISTGISSLLILPVNSAFLGLFFITLGASFVVIKIFKGLSRSVVISGVQFFKGDPRSALSVYGYRYSQKSKEYFDAMGTENKALGKILSSGELFPEDRVSAGEGESVTPAQRLQKEMIEYFVLNTLSSHLSSHFDDDASSNILNIGRKDIPGVLLDNRFMEVFSRPMEDREVFSEIKDHYSITRIDPGGVETVVAVYAKGGAIYDRFELILPRRTKIERSGSEVIIKTPRFSMSISVRFNGFTAVVPREFIEIYMRGGFEEIRTYLSEVKIDTKFNFLSVFTPSGWGYYKWMDSFIEEMHDKFSFDRFLVRIGWSCAFTSAVAFAGMQNRIAKDSRKVRGEKRGQVASSEVSTDG